GHLLARHRRPGGGGDHLPRLLPAARPDGQERGAEGPRRAPPGRPQLRLGRAGAGAQGDPPRPPPPAHRRPPPGARHRLAGGGGGGDAGGQLGARLPHPRRQEWRAPLRSGGVGNGAHRPRGPRAGPRGAAAGAAPRPALGLRGRGDRKMNSPGETAPQAAEKLRLTDLTVTFESEGKQVPVLDGIALTVAPGEFVCILGPSGCGKSTLLNVVGGFLRPTAGKVEIDGREVTGPDPRRIFVFQERGVFPWLTAEENIGFGLDGLPREERRERVRRYVELVGLQGFERAFPAQLSGGAEQ